MLSQIIPSKPAGNPRVRLRVPRGFWLAGVLCPLRRRDFSPPASVRRGVVKSRPGGGVDGPLRLELHQSPRRQGARFDSFELSGRPGQGRVRGALCPSGARSAGAGCRRQRAAGDDRRHPRALLAVLGRVGAALDGAQRHLGGAEGRYGGADGAERGAQGACRHRRYRDLRGARAQIPDLGAGTVPRTSRCGADAACATSSAPWVAWGFQPEARAHDGSWRPFRCGR